MLKQLDVKNYAIIEHSTILFEDGFSTITGETGAGKSILLGALSLILGNRADKKAILDRTKKSYIEGTFLINHSFETFFKEKDLDFELETVVRREISPSGKSRAFINDTPVTLETLKLFTSQLIDLHRQHESMSITTSNFQRDLVDIYANLAKDLSKYQEEYITYKDKLQLLNQLKEESIAAAKEKDFVSFQVDELQNIDLQENELNNIEQELSKLENHTQIVESLSSVQNLISEESTIIESLQQARQEFQKLKSLDETFETFYERLDSIVIELEDLEKEVNFLEVDTDQDPNRISTLRERLDAINRLMSKHKVNTGEDLLTIQKQLEEQLLSYESNGDKILALEKDLVSLKESLWKKAKALHKKRVSIQSKIQEKTEKILHSVGMPNARVRLEILELEQLNSYGNSSVELLFTPNNGQQPQPLKNIASGGELSRLMLAIKTLIADKTTLPTMIFDEIDTGISGEIAIKVGKLLRKLADKHQIISITHLPQIAAKSHHHLKVYKENRKGETRSNVKTLSTEEREYEIAEMLYGDPPSPTSLQTARELMNA